MWDERQQYSPSRSPSVPAQGLGNSGFLYGTQGLRCLRGGKLFPRATLTPAFGSVCLLMNLTSKQ